MATKLPTSSALSQLSLTPLIDIVFLLLIFFLVATRFAEEERELDVLLPEASEAQPLTSKPRELFINIDEDGRYYVTGKIVTLGELQPLLHAAYVNNPGRASVVIRADRRCRWEFVVSAMNACNRAKIRDYRVSTKEGPSG
jgi:biopolymer transport protein ExbD